jgi:hypothetical protein
MWCGTIATGVGGDKWYRFVGYGGDALPLHRPRGEHQVGFGGILACGTSHGGWLSGCDLSLHWNFPLSLQRGLAQLVSVNQMTPPTLWAGIQQPMKDVRRWRCATAYP